MSESITRALNGQTVRFAVVGVLVLLMLIPLAFVQGVTHERRQYFQEAAADIAAAWGGRQSLTGPFLVVPEPPAAATGASETEPPERRQQRVLLPRSLDVVVEVPHQTRTRGIYEVPVYQAVARFSGEFVVPESGTEVRQLTDAAQLLMGIADTHAVEAVSELELADTTASFSPGTGHAWLGEGVHADTVIPTPGVPVHFDFQVTLRGSGTLNIAPIGAATQIAMTSSWPHPSFTGRYLPREHDIGPQGFTARWVVHELARALPESWIQNARQASLTEYRPTEPRQLGYASVSLFQPVTAYTRVDRGIKYGVLFIGLTFLSFVCFEMLTAVRFHYVQYGVVGAGLVLFYLALLSLSEALPFLASYVIAAGLLGALVTWYVWMITRRLRLVVGVLGILAALYLCLYVLLELEAYALLVGTGVLSVGLFALMYATSRLDGASVEAAA